MDDIFFPNLAAFNLRRLSLTSSFNMTLASFFYIMRFSLGVKSLWFPSYSLAESAFKLLS
jgi:hypothetical protein